MNRLWALFIVVLVLSFAVLGWIGTRIHEEMPPIPARVVSTDGKVVIDQGEISAGQNVWQTLGGMQVGSIWGHGSYVAPDWTADWLHREAVFILDRWAADEFNAKYAALSPGMEVMSGMNLGPWDYGQEALRIFRSYSVLHMSLLPYRYAAAQESARRGDRIGKVGKLERLRTAGRFG